MVHYEIRSVAQHELSACLATLHAAFGESEKRFGYTKETYPSSGAYITLEDLMSAKERGVHMYAAYVGDVVAGYVQLEKIKDGVYAFRRFAVLPEYQNLGLGKALIAHCRKRAAAIGARRIELLMIYENTGLLAFYESNGFRLVRTGKDEKYPFEYAIMEMEI
ncbi:MAG: GNAT family N-acetyltransferase [Ruminococcaceae bacterium]|nr:GNAT family N-acetyltransferase [Oscillospiraceae bacterium]